ncbi:hypothetical protein [Streptomyces beijiangensis]|uniref:Lipoprotein n=1 Tax=Streptomyces beijiangensis TaxID=163361 RepID=A0A939F7Z0_9ACTN|nr:hypothetical protein [Streptomyces beijiangensis]MBO0513727.1 hypothetical protein [Streptomyces beijiangensis]
MRRTAPPRARQALGRAAALTTAVCLTAALGAGCSSRPSAGKSSTPTPTPAESSSVTACTKLISYWAKETLTGGKWAGLDWEQKGLSNQQYELMDTIIQNARTERKLHGLPAAKTLIDRQSKDRCTATNGATWSSENWRPPK